MVGNRKLGGCINSVGLMFDPTELDPLDKYTEKPRT